MSANDLLKQAEDANKAELEHLRLKATQALLKEREREVKKVESIVKGIDANLEQVAETDDTRLLERLAAENNTYGI